jgi:hypothetical protein
VENSNRLPKDQTHPEYVGRYSWFANHFFVRIARMQGRLLLGLAVLTTAISIGCGGGSTNQDVPPGELAVTPPTMDFGKVAVGARKTRTGTLRAGDSGITVTSVDWSGEGYSLGGIVFPLTVAAGQSVHFKVTFAPHRAGGSAGNISFQSDALNTPRAGFNGTGNQKGAHSVTLSWHSTAAAVLGYNVYRAVASKGPYTRMNSSPHPRTTFTDASVLSGETYFYLTTTVSKNGIESRYSNQVQVRIPNS